MRRSQAPSNASAPRSGTTVEVGEKSITTQAPVMKRRCLAIPSVSKNVPLGGASQALKQSKENHVSRPAVAELVSVQYFTVLYTKKVPNKVFHALC